MIHIVFFAPYEAASAAIEQVFAERGQCGEELTYEVRLDHYNNPLGELHADAVISRGFTAQTLQRRGLLPSVELKTTGYDVITAVDQCLRRFPCGRIAVVGAFNMVYGAESVGCVYRDISIRCYPAHEETELEAYVKKAIADGAQAIVGGCSTVAISEKYGVPAVLIESGKEAINNAIDEAVGVVSLTRREQRKSREVANIFDYSFQGVLATDHEGVITLANRYCRPLLPGGGELIGKRAALFFPAVPFDAVIRSGRKILSDIHHVGDRTLMLNCVPVEGMQGNTGCVLTFQDVTQIQEEEGKIRKRMHKKGFVAKYRFDDILFEDRAMRDAIGIASDYSESGSNLLILGETGTGKELFAQSVHNASRRRGEPFVAVNCAALPEELLESELFGYVEGAFTGAAKGGKMGLFEIAHKGTVFLDEIGDISAKLQGRLLRVLQEREIIRLGHDAVTPVDVRVISATNKDLREEVHKGLFRQDLLYRLDVLELKIPSLRERRADILPLISHYISQEREKTGCILSGLSPEAKQMAVNYGWPGNVRELRNFCERICVLCKQAYASPGDLLRALPVTAPLSQAAKADAASGALEEGELLAIREALRLHQGNRGRTAAYLGIDKSTLWRKMKKYGIAGF